MRYSSALIGILVIFSLASCRTVEWERIPLYDDIFVAPEYVEHPPRKAPVNNPTYQKQYQIPDFNNQPYAPPPKSMAPALPPQSSVKAPRRIELAQVANSQIPPQTYEQISSMMDVEPVIVDTAPIVPPPYNQEQFNQPPTHEFGAEMVTADTPHSQITKEKENVGFAEDSAYFGMNPNDNQPPRLPAFSYKHAHPDVNQPVDKTAQQAIQIRPKRPEPGTYFDPEKRAEKRSYNWSNKTNFYGYSYFPNRY